MSFEVQYTPSPSPSPPLKATQNDSVTPMHSIQMSELESYQIQTESYVKRYFEVNKKNDFETIQQVSSKLSIQMPRNKQYLKSQLSFARAGPSKTFIQSDSTHSNLMKLLSSRSKFARTVTSNGGTGSNESTYWPTESYVGSTYVPSIKNNKSMFHSQQQNENNDSQSPEQSTSVKKYSVISTPQVLLQTFKSSDVEQSTDDETSKHSIKEVSGIKHSPSPVQAGLSQKKLASAESVGTTLSQVHQSPPLPLQFAQTSYNKYLMSNGSPQRTTATKLDDRPILCYPGTARSYMTKEQSPLKIPVTDAFDHSYSRMTQSDGTKSVVEKHPETQAMVEPQNQANYNSALLVSNEVVIESNELTDFPKIRRVDSKYAGDLSKNDLPQAVNKNKLKSNDLTREQSTMGLKHSPSRAGSCDTSNSFNAINKSPAIPVDESQIKLQSTNIPADIKNTLATFSDIIPEEIRSGQEYQLQLLPIQFTKPLTAPSFNMNERSNEPPVKTYTTSIANKVIIEPPKKSVVKSTYAGALPKNHRKNSNQLIQNPKTSKTVPMIGSDRLNLQSKLPRIAGAANGRTIYSNVDVKSSGSIKEPASAVKLPQQTPRKITNQPATQQKLRNVKPVEQVLKPHPLPKTTVTFDTKSTSLKRKLEENILPIVSSKKPLLQDPNELQIIMHGKTLSLPDVSVKHLKIVRGIEKKETIRTLKINTSSELNANEMTFSDCMDTLLRNNVHGFKVPVKPNNVLDKYFKILEKNNVSVTKIKK